MKLLFMDAYKGKNPFMWLTAMWTRGRYSHCEFLFDDGMMFGASFLKGRCRWAESDVKDRDDYLILELDLSAEQVKDLRVMCQKFNKKRYDYMGLFGFVFKTKEFNHKGKYFCSELMAHILEEYTDFVASRRPCRMSPVRLERDIQEFITSSILEETQTGE